MVGLRLNQQPPNVTLKKKATGGVSVSSTCQLTSITEKDVYQLLHEYKIHAAEVLFREDCTIDQFIDVIEGNRKYVRCLYVYNKIDMTSIEEVRRAAEGWRRAAKAARELGNHATALAEIQEMLQACIPPALRPVARWVDVFCCRAFAVAAQRAC